MSSIPIGSGHTVTTDAYYLDRIRREMAANKAGKTASQGLTPQYGIDVSDSSTVTDAVTTTSMGAPTAFMVLDDSANEELFLELDQDVVDGSKNAHTTTIAGTETYSTGPLISTTKGLKSFSFNGSSDLTVSTEGDFDRDRTDTFSIAFWASFTSSSDAALVTKMTAAANQGYAIMISGTGKIRIRLINTATTNEVDVISPAAYHGTGWNHFCFTKGSGSNAAACKLYVNGSAITLTTTTDNLSATILNAIPLVIGAYDGGTARFTGFMYDVHWYNTELSAANAAKLADGLQISLNGSVTTPAYASYCTVVA